MIPILLFALSEAALACSIIGPMPFVLDDTLSDDSPPAMAEVLDLSIVRGRGPERTSNGSMMSTSCDDLGFIDITLADPEGDLADDVGYYLELVDGELGEEMSLPSDPWTGQVLTLSWIDGATDDQDVLSFTLSITPVDRAGNLGEPIELFIEDDGVPDDDTAFGCSSVPGAPVGGLWVLVGLLAARRRS